MYSRSDAWPSTPVDSKQSLLSLPSQISFADFYPASPGTLESKLALVDGNSNSLDQSIHEDLINLLLGNCHFAQYRAMIIDHCRKRIREATFSPRIYVACLERLNEEQENSQMGCYEGNTAVGFQETDRKASVENLEFGDSRSNSKYSPPRAKST